MAITQNLASRMGGSISLVSKENEGSSFTIELPLPEVKGEEKKGGDYGKPDTYC